MNSSYIELSNLDLAIATGLILVNGAISVALRLDLGKTLLIASVRSIVQLLLIGLILDRIFALDRWYLVLALLLTMTVIAGVTAASRSERRYPGVYWSSIVSVWASSWLIGAIALLAIVRPPEAWYQPQYAVPLLGMVLGNSLNGIALGLNRLGEELTSRREQVEMMLTLGATRWEAARAPIQNAIRTGMVPMINSMTVVGIVNLPGMMTGQILAGARPMDAVKYQIVIMFLIASASALGTMGVVLLSYRRLFNSRHQFLYRLLRD